MVRDQQSVSASERRLVQIPADELLLLRILHPAPTQQESGPAVQQQTRPFAPRQFAPLETRHSGKNGGIAVYDPVSGKKLLNHQRFFVAYQPLECGNDEKIDVYGKDLFPLPAEVPESGLE